MPDFELYEDNINWVRNVVMRCITKKGAWDLLDSQDVEDLVQDFLVKVKSGDLKAYEGRFGASIKTYAWRIISNDVHNLKKSKIRHRNILIERSMDIRLLNYKPENRTIKRQILVMAFLDLIKNKISERDYQICVKHFVDGVSINEVAEYYGCDRHDIDVQLAKARKHLYKLYDEGKLGLEGLD